MRRARGRTPGLVNRWCTGLLLVGLLSFSVIVSEQGNGGGRDAQPTGAARAMWFEPNVGQAGPEARYLAKTAAGALLLLPTSSVLVGPTSMLRAEFVGANPEAEIVGAGQLAGRLNYLRGDDPSRWQTGVATYGQVHYRDLYPGIDLVYRGDQGGLEYDLVVAPGADPATVALRFGGQRRSRIDGHGDLVLVLDGSEIRHRRPVAYQEIGGERRLVPAAYRLANDRRVRFSVGKYDRSRPLVIDPLVYSTFLGGPSQDAGLGVAVDGAGNTYITGTAATGFPTLGTPISPYTGQDSFVTKLNAAGSDLVYSTYLGGTGGDVANGIAVDGAGNAYVAGTTTSTDFPGAAPFPGFPAATPTGSAFVVKLNPAGSALVYSRYLAGTCAQGPCTGAEAIAVDSSGNTYVTGSTRASNFPTVGAFQSTSKGGDGDAFVTKVNPAGTALVYSSYLGGTTPSDQASGIAVDAVGNAYVGGWTGSTDFPIAGTPFQSTKPSPAGTFSGFVTKVNAAGSGLIYSTFLGGSASDRVYALAVDASGSVYVTGQADSANFPLAGSPFDTTRGGAQDAFVTKLNPSGSGLVYSTYLGGNGVDHGDAIAVDGAGVAHVGGATFSVDFVTVDAIQVFKKNDYDAFVTRVNPAGSAVLFSTYLGSSGSSSYADWANAIAVDAAGNDYVAGTTAGPDFPMAGSPVQGTFGGGTDVFVTKISANTTPPHPRPPSDFDGDGKTDVGVFRPSTGVWYLRQSSGGGAATTFGVTGDIPVPGDYDGDGKADIAVYRPSTGVWYIRPSAGAATATPFGVSGDTPVPGDYDGDGKADIAVYRPATGVWYVRPSGGGGTATVFGVAGDTPVPGDYDGDGKTDLAVFRSSTGVWYVRQSGGGATSVLFGVTGDLPVPGFYDADAKTDQAVFRPSNGVWYIRQSTGGGAATPFGVDGDTPVPGDYDGDGRTDHAVYRPATGVWYQLLTAGGAAATPFGISGDVPLVKVVGG